jgi:hypothetical protein
VRERLEQMAGALNIQELVVNTITWDHAARLRSYELLAREFELPGFQESAMNASAELVQNG